ncbi:MAG: DUF3570 domain-containing protein [Myxococcota bacterium]
MKSEDRHEGTDLEIGEAAFKLPRPSKALTALTTSALALPGVAGSARADAPIERATGSSAFSYYKEDNLSPSRFAGAGSRERYEVFTKQLRFDVPITERADIGIDFLYEEMSGASPWFVEVDPDNTSEGRLQVMSGATIEDERYDLTLDADFYMDEGKDSVSAGFSKERDYLSVHGGLGTERNFNDKNTTFSGSFAFAYDWVEPTDADIFIERPSAGERFSFDLFAGLSQLISRSSTAQVTLNYKHSDGYLSDPYKAIKGFGPGDVLLSDQRPDSKDQVSILVRYRHHFEAVTGSLHLDYRFYHDDWNVNSHTAEIAWYQNFFDILTITPGLRWYSQSKADFYDTVLNPGVTEDDPRNRSSDFRLSPYGAISWKIKAEVEIVDLFEYQPPGWLEALGVSEGFDLTAAVSYERYLSDGDLSIVNLKETDEAPGLVRFRLFAFTLSGRF